MSRFSSTPTTYRHAADLQCFFLTDYIKTLSLISPPRTTIIADRLTRRRNKSAQLDSFIFDINMLAVAANYCSAGELDSVLLQVSAASNSCPDFGAGVAMIANPFIIVPIQLLSIFGSVWLNLVHDMCPEAMVAR